MTCSGYEKGGGYDMVHEVGDVERNLSAIYWFHSFMAFSFMLQEIPDF